MLVDSERLERALSQFRETADGLCRCGAFADLKTDLQLRMAPLDGSGGTIPDVNQQEALRCLRFISEDLWNIETLLDRINWQCELWVADNLCDARWNVYVTADIDLFHVEFRSLFDYLARLIRALAEKPGQVPDEASFERLANWVKKSDTNANSRLGNELAAVVRSAEWFPLIRQVRNDIVHRGASTLVFYEKPRVLFQTYNCEEARLIALPEVMYNDNVVDFELYAAVFYGYLLDYLEEIANLAYERMNLERVEGRSRHYNLGLTTARRWLMNAIEKMGR